jgi:hypothetical protein
MFRLRGSGETQTDGSSDQLRIRVEEVARKGGSDDKAAMLFRAEVNRWVCGKAVFISVVKDDWFTLVSRKARNTSKITWYMAEIREHEPEGRPVARTYLIVDGNSTLQDEVENEVNRRYNSSALKRLLRRKAGQHSDFTRA